jgi:tetratricopeptide (TPR) repeat protein
MAWTIHPSNEEIALVMEAGFLYRDLREYEQARDVFRGVRALLPKSEVPEVALGLVAFQQGDFEGSARHYRRALELNPLSAWAYAHLGELALFQMDEGRARTHLNTAIELDPRGVHGKFARALMQFADEIKFQ